MEGNFDGVEEYPNAFPIDWCKQVIKRFEEMSACLLYTSPSPRDRTRSRMPSSA